MQRFLEFYISRIIWNFSNYSPPPSPPSKVIQVQNLPENERKRTRDRVRACRLRKKEAAKKAKVDSPDTAASTPTKKGYQTPQGLNKAMKKVHEVLSDSPSKAAQTVQGLANFYNIKLDDKMNNQIRPNRAIDPETIKLVKEFYFRTDIVYTMPGMNDEMTIWTNGKKEKLRKFIISIVTR